MERSGRGSRTTGSSSGSPTERACASERSIGCRGRRLSFSVNGSRSSRARTGSAAWLWVFSNGGRLEAAHELAHLRERNHSPRFWVIVGLLYPDHRAARRELNARAPTLPDL